MEALDGERQLSRLKISRNKILELKVNNKYHENRECQVLNVKFCHDFTEAQLNLASISFENFPNIFVIILEISNFENEEFEKFLKFLNIKFPKNREIFVQSCTSLSSVWHHKAKNNDNFMKIDLSNDTKLFLSRFKINKKIETKNFFEILKFLNVSIINVNFNEILDFLSLSRDNDKFLLLKSAVKSENEQLVRFLMLFVNNLPSDLLEHALQAKNVTILILILNNFNAEEINQKNVDQILNHEKSHEILMEIADKNNLNVLEILLKDRNNFAKAIHFDIWCQAKNKAFEKNFHDFFYKLQAVEEKFYQENSVLNFPEPSVKKQRLVTNKIPYFNDLKNLHANIHNGNLKIVKEFMETFPEFKFCNFEQKCALEKSIESKKFDIYAFLVSKSFLAYDEERFYGLMRKLSDEDNNKIQKEHLKILKLNPDNFIYKLVTKIDLFAGAIKLSFAEVLEMLEKLNEHEENREVMRIASQADVRIVFDLVNSSIKTMVPRKDDCVMGTTDHRTNILYVGKNDDKMSRYGTFIHELMHFVLRLIYENKALPYCKEDTERETKWTEIVEELKKSHNDSIEDIIRRVFSEYLVKYDVSHVHKKEAAVRVNHMLAFYHNNPLKIEELEGMFPNLFSFIRNEVLLDLKTPNIYRMIKLNNDFGLIQKIKTSQLQVKPTGDTEILNLATEQSNKILITSNVPQLVLSKIYNEVKGLPGNKLNLKAKNFFVDERLLDQKHLKEEFKDLVKTTSVDRIIVVSSDFKQLENDLKPHVQYFFIANNDCDLKLDNENFERHEVNIQWQDLTEKTQDFLLNKSINFQDEKINLLKLLSDVENLISPEILKILCSDSEIKVNCSPKVENLEKFIKRTIQIKKKIISEETKRNINDENVYNFYDDFSLENFIIKTQNEQILVISDVAGSGKTTLLTKIHEILKDQFPLHFVIFISLIKFVEELSQGVGEDFTGFIAKILKFDELEREIFIKKYEKGEVKILFDAFDEISPICKENTTKLFKLFQSNGKNQAFITSRNHLEHDLEKDLELIAHRIKTLTKEEQTQFVEEYWDHKDRNLVKKSSNLLVDKITKIISSNSSIIGVPLIVQGLAEAYKDKIDENFEHEIGNLDISSVYEKIVETSLNILSLRFPQKLRATAKMSMNPLQIHQFLAICLLFKEEIANSLGLNHDEEEWTFEEIARCGLGKYDKDGKFLFNHQTYAEYLIAVFIFHLLKNVKNLTSAQIDIIFEVLTENKFYIIRLFLDSFLNRVENFHNFKSCHKICENVKGNKNFLEICINLMIKEYFFNICDFFVMTIKNNDLVLFKEFIEFENEEKATNFMRILPIALNIKKFERILDEILNFYSENIFDDFLYKADQDGDTILQFFATHTWRTDIIKCFWNRIKVFFADDAQIKNYLLKQGYFGRNALIKSTACRNENTFYFLFEEIYCYYFNIREIANMKDEINEKFLHYLVRFGSTPMLQKGLEKLKNELPLEDFQNLFKLKSKYCQNLLHCVAIQNEQEKHLEFVVRTIEDEIGSQEVKKMLSEHDHFNQLPLHCVVRCNFTKVFEVFFSIYVKFFTKSEIESFIRIEDSRFNKNVFELARDEAKNKEIFETVKLLFVDYYDEHN